MFGRARRLPSLVPCWTSCDKRFGSVVNPACPEKMGMRVSRQKRAGQGGPASERKARSPRRRGKREARVGEESARSASEEETAGGPGHKWPGFLKTRRPLAGP